MESYSPLLEKTRVPQPSLQKFGVISIFEKLRSAPPHLDANSDPGREAITQCLQSTTPSVVDQSVRELCRLVMDSKLNLSRGLLELQSALEGTDSRFVNLFVKALGFLVGLGFRRNSSSFRFHSSQAHPFVKVLSCRLEVQSGLLHQVHKFMVQNRHTRMVEVCEFLRPFLNFSVIRMPHIAWLSSFIKNLVASMASFCCLFPLEAMPVIQLLMGSLKYFPCNNAEDFTNISYCMEYIVDAYVEALRQLVGMGLLVHEVQTYGVELLETIMSLCVDFFGHSAWREVIIEKSNHLLVVMKELGLHYSPKLSSIVLSLFITLVKSELEHEQLSVLKLFLFLLRWRTDNEYGVSGVASNLSGELLFIFPVTNLVSYPSKSVKRASTDLLFILEKLSFNMLVTPAKELSKQDGFPSVSRLEHIIFRLLQHLWFQDQYSSSRFFYLNLLSFGGTNVKEHSISKTWTSLVREYFLQIVERKKSLLSISQSQQSFLSEMPLIIDAIASVLVMHETLGISAVDLLAFSSNVDPKLGVPLLLLILYYNYIFSGKGKKIDFHNVLLKLLEMIPSLGSQSAMTPVVVQTILPMLQKDQETVLYATALRLLCKTWEINDRVFGSLQGLLLPKGFAQFSSDRNICISMAVSVRDICRRNPDRGVDLILSVSACIESQDPIIQSLGFQSLAHLCGADVIDFYTAWDVVATHVQNFVAIPIVAHSICLFLRWGALDADAYPETAAKVILILWEVATSRHSGHGSSRAKARVSAFDALAQYEVLHIQNSIPDFRGRNMALLISETDLEVLKAIEAFEVKIITYEHMTRRRFVKEKRVSANKMEKLLDVFPQVIFALGNERGAKEFPGAALFCLSFTPKDLNKHGVSKGLEDVHEKYGNALVEIASSLQLSRNILTALLSVQSWKPFMLRWMKACVTFFDNKGPSSASDKTCRVASDILKSVGRIGEACIPRCAENIALAVGALCMVLPPSAHAIKSTASKFLLNWLVQSEHEYRQWSAAISLGLISSCLHVTDHKQKYENINALLKVLYSSKSTLVKGASGIGLGFSCQDLFTRSKIEDHNHLGKEAYTTQETVLLRKIIGALSQMICPLTRSSSDFQSILQYFPLGRDDIDALTPFDVMGGTCDELEEDIWGVAGLVIGLGSSVSAVYRSGAKDAVLKIKSMITSWIPHMNPSVYYSAVSERYEIILSVGACLALPIVISFCQRVDLVDDSDFGHLVSGYRELIAELTSMKKTSIFPQSLLMASCIGAGSLLACFLNEGLHPIEVEHVKDLLALFKRTYSNPHHPLVHLGGMLGVVNALGAGAGTHIQFYSLTSSRISHDQKDSSYITGPLLSSPVIEPDLLSLIQDIFLVAQNSDDRLLQQYAAWAVSFLRHYIWFREGQKNNSSQGDAIGSNSPSQNFQEDSTVMKLSLWLMHLNHPRTGIISHVNSIVIALRCLSHTPRLPTLDWGVVVRRCMKYEGQVAEFLPTGSVLKKGILKEECLLFSLVHAQRFDPLLSFLDELYDLSRFNSLELSLQSCMLLHLADVMKNFSASRVEKLFDDVSGFISLLTSVDQPYDAEQRSLLRVSCWKGLYLCLDETLSGPQVYIYNMERCMELLFCALPSLNRASISTLDKGQSVEEWSEAVRCLGKARREWLMDLLQVDKYSASEMDFLHVDDHSLEIQKKIQARARLVQIGSLPLSELGKLKAYVLNTRSQVVWDVLVEFAATLQYAEGSAKRQWLVDAMEITCVTNYPSTALQFVGLLCGFASKYMPLLTVDQLTVLSDLPLTLRSLLTDNGWHVVVESIISHLWTLMERIYDWVTKITSGDDSFGSHDIDKSENKMAVFLLQVVHHTCVSLKDHLAPEKQLILANMLVH